jgi:hypothetical protein
MAGNDMETRGFKKRFGTIAVEKGFVRKEQLAEALKTQVMEEIEQGQHRLIGTILHEKGFIAFPQLQEVLESLQIMSGI